MKKAYQRLLLSLDKTSNAVLPTELFQFRYLGGEWNRLKAAADIRNSFASVLSQNAFEQISGLRLEEGRPQSILVGDVEKYFTYHFPIDVRVTFGKGSLFSRFDCTVIRNHGKILGKYDIYLSTPVLRSLGHVSSNNCNVYIRRPKYIDDVLHHPVCRQKNVVIIGKDAGEGLLRMKLIETLCMELGYITIILKDYEEIAEASLEQKFLSLASNSRFVICENTFSSGHIDELKISFVNNFPICILQEKQHSATWLQINYPYDSKMVYLREYLPGLKSKSPEELCLTDAVIESTVWAESRVQERTDYLNKLYRWRKTDRNIELYMLQEFSRNWYNLYPYKLLPWQAPVDINYSI